MSEPISPEYRAMMNRLADALSKAFPGTGFVLLQFPFGGPDKARVNYISNANREDMLAALKEITARFEGQHHEGGRA